MSGRGPWLAGEKPLVRYSEAQMATIRARIVARDEAWLSAVWDPVLVPVYGWTLMEAAERGIVFEVGQLGIPWDQSEQISKWCHEHHFGSMDWLSFGPSPVRDGDEGWTVVASRSLDGPVPP